MLQNFFSLNGTTNEFSNFRAFKNYRINHNSIRNYVYKPNKLCNDKIQNNTFKNVSFSKTIIENVEFLNCHFIDCLFIGSEIKKCKFIECSFIGCNTYAIKIYKSYINPSFFDDNFKGFSYSYSNIVVQLYQELFNNSVDQQIIDFSRKAKYNLLKWEGRLLISKYKYKQPYKIPFCLFIWEYLPNIVFRKVFGYGLRLRNFTVTFLIIYLICFITNYICWNKYNFVPKVNDLDFFTPNDYSNLANFYYTNDVLMKIVDSQYQPSSNCGMFIFTIQGSLGFILFGFLGTVIINKFVK